jgi:hypothetical protein
MNDPLSPFSRHLVESVRGAHQPDAATKQRVRRSLDARLTAVAVLGGSTLLGTLAKAMGVTVLTASVVTGGVWAVRAQKQASEPAQKRAVARTAIVQPLVPEPSSPLSPLEQELALLNEAQAALRAHQPAQALAQLERHAQAFPTGFMAQERQAARALALCELGRKSEARALAAQFVRSWPASPLVSRMNEVCVALTPHSGALPRAK